MLSQKHIQVLNKFLENWKRKTYVEGAFLTGSAVTSYFSKYSDLDVYIVLSPRVRWRERGDVVIDGALIEYFANPVEQISRKMDDKEIQKNGQIFC